MTNAKLDPIDDFVMATPEMREAAKATFVEETAKEYVALKKEIEKKTARLRLLATWLAEDAQFPEGKNTAHMVEAGYNFTIQRKENVRWDQKILRDTRLQLGDDLFFKLFDWEFKPITRTLKGFMETNPEQAPYIEAARTVSPGAPQISFEAIEQAGEV